jgi:hypothetical protein
MGRISGEKETRSYCPAAGFRLVVERASSRRRARPAEPVLRAPDRAVVVAAVRSYTLDPDQIGQSGTYLPGIVDR